jgi:GtrA-like protein
VPDLRATVNEPLTSVPGGRDGQASTSGWPGRPRPANVIACAVAAVPSFHLNRSWAWGRRGRSRLLREVAPFWALAFLGLAFSTWAADMSGAPWPPMRPPCTR